MLSVELVVACLTETLQFFFSSDPSIAMAVAVITAWPPDFAIIYPSALTETTDGWSLLQDTSLNLRPSGDTFTESVAESPTVSIRVRPSISMLSGFFTTTVQPPLFPLPSTASARMTAVPTPFATTIPDGFTDATSEFLLFHSTPLSVAFLGYTVAPKLADSPTDSVREDGLTCMH